VLDLVHQPQAIAVRKRRPQHQQLIQRQPQPIDVGALVAFALEPFRGHVAQRADDVAGDGQRVLLRFGQAEIGDPDDAGGVQKQVRRLDVPVDNAAGMGVGQGVGRLPADASNALKIMVVVRAYAGQIRLPRQHGRRGGGVTRQWQSAVSSGWRLPTAAADLDRRPRQRFRTTCFAGRRRRFRDFLHREAAGQERLRQLVHWRPTGVLWAGEGVGRLRPRALAVSRLDAGRLGPQAAQLFDDLIQRLPLNELHGVITGVAVLADVKNRYDVGVVQLGGGPRLAAEALQGVTVTGDTGREQLESHAPAQRHLLGLVDDAHAASGNLAQDAVVTHLL
jgi:hypothetical protein